MKKKILKNWYIGKAKVKLERLLKFYSPNEKVLDIGSGNGGLNLLLQNNNINITGIDIKNKSFFKEIEVVIYDGKTFPFEDKHFETVQIITVLHHIKEQIPVIKEAIRVGKRIIIMEDIYDNFFQKYFTWYCDSLNNWEFIGHPHTNRTDDGWRKLFKELNLEIEKVEYYKFLLFFKQVTYTLKIK